MSDAEVPLPDATCRELAQRLLVATRDAEPLESLAVELPNIEIPDAYAIQRAGLDLRLAEGDDLRGHKVGLTSAAMQEMLGVAQPDFGYLVGSMLVPSRGEIRVDELIAPRAEAEIAFLLGERLEGPGITAEGVLAATAGVAPAIEVIDSRIADWRITIVDTIADNASSARAVFGEFRSPPIRDLADLEVVLRAGDAEVSGPGRAVLGHPANAVAWLANTLATFDGSLEADEVVLPGAVAKALPVHAGTTAFAGLGSLGNVEVTFR